MQETKPAFHGSDVEQIEKIYGISQKEIAQFGSNVNPLGISPMMKTALTENIEIVTSYPDRAYTALRSAIASYTHTRPAWILPGNGSTELISLAMKVTHPKKACIMGPTYSEYSREIGLAGGSCFFHILKESDDFYPNLKRLETDLSENVDLLVLCNPNNPTGTALSTTALSEILELCRRLDVLVVIDETYVEFTEDPDTVSACTLLSRFDNLLILRGTSKFFAAPGLRLGYALCANRQLLQNMQHLQDPWSVNSLAAKAGEAIFADQAYISRTRQYINEERRRIMEHLQKIKALKPFSPAANFVLIKILDSTKSASDFFEYAIRRGLMIRDCSDFPGLGSQFFRFCFLEQENNDRLLECIDAFF